MQFDAHRGYSQLGIIFLTPPQNLSYLSFRNLANNANALRYSFLGSKEKVFTIKSRY